MGRGNGEGYYIVRVQGTECDGCIPCVIVVMVMESVRMDREGCLMVMGGKRIGDGKSEEVDRLWKGWTGWSDGCNGQRRGDVWWAG